MDIVIKMTTASIGFIIVIIRDLNNNNSAVSREPDGFSKELQLTQSSWNCCWERRYWVIKAFWGPVAKI